MFDLLNNTVETPFGIFDNKNIMTHSNFLKTKNKKATNNSIRKEN